MGGFVGSCIEVINYVLACKIINYNGRSEKGSFPFRRKTTSRKSVVVGRSPPLVDWGGSKPIVTLGCGVDYAEEAYWMLITSQNPMVSTTIDRGWDRSVV